MVQCCETNQFPCPATIAYRSENVTISRFQIAFGIETDRGQGTMTRRAPEEENVCEFSGLDH
jgi:hypothetical protein